MKTLYDKLPYGTKTEDRAIVNSKMNKMKFTGGELRGLYIHGYKPQVFFANRLFYPFIDWLWDKGVELHLNGEKVNKKNIMIDY